MLEREDVEGGFLSFEVDEALHHAADVWGDACVADDGGVAHSLEASLRAVVREGADVVHVSMGDGDVLCGEHGAWALAHVEGDIEFWDGDGCGFAGDGDALHAERRDIEKAERTLPGWGLWEHV